LETDSLTVELTPLLPLLILRLLIVDSKTELATINSQKSAINNYLTSLWAVCLRQRRQNFLNSSRSVVVLRFFVVE
jgi:hypothetical protein